jgi:hypothetical protein
MLFWVENDIFCGSVYFDQQIKKKTNDYFFLITISCGTPSDISRNPGWETLL